MAKGGKKGRTKEQVALYAEIANLMRTLNQRSQESVAIAQKLAEAQNNLPDILKRLSENAEKASQSAKNFNKGQREGTENTNTFSRSLMRLELSLHRLQRGLNGVKNVALFAEEIAKDATQFYNMANAINASASEMRKLDFASAIFGARVGEASGLVRGLKTDMANMRMGRGAGQLEHLMKFWGLNITGRESEQDLIVKIFKRYKSIPKELRPAFQQDAYQLSDGMVKMFSKFNGEGELREFLSKQKVADSEESKNAAERTTAESAKKKNEQQNANIANLTANGELTNKTNQLLQEIYGFMQEHPWLMAAQLGLQATGALGSVASGAKGLVEATIISKLLKGAKVTSVLPALGKGAVAVEATTLASKGAGAIGMGTFGWIAVSLAAIVGGWWALDTIAEKAKKDAESDKRGKPENQSTEERLRELEAAIKARTEAEAKAKEKLAEANKYGSASDQRRATQEVAKAGKEREAAVQDRDDSVPKMLKYDQLVKLIDETLPKIDRGEVVPDSVYAEMEQGARDFSEIRKRLEEKYHTTLAEGFKQTQMFNLFKTGSYGELARVIGETEAHQNDKNAKGEYAYDIKPLQDFIMSGKADNLSEQEKQMFSAYMKSNLSTPQYDKLYTWFLENENGYQKHGGEEGWLMQAFEEAQVFHPQGAGGIYPMNKGNKEDVTRKGNWDKVNPYRYNSLYQQYIDSIPKVDMKQAEAIRDAQEKATDVEKRLQDTVGKVDQANYEADRAMSRGDVIDNSQRTASFNPTVYINNKYDVNQSFSGSQDAGTAMASAKREAERMERAATDDIATQILGGFDRFKSNMTA